MRVLTESLLEHEWASTRSTRPSVHIVGEVSEIIDHLDRLYGPEPTLVA